MEQSINLPSIHWTTLSIEFDKNVNFDRIIKNLIILLMINRWMLKMIIIIILFFCFEIQFSLLQVNIIKKAIERYFVIF